MTELKKDTEDDAAQDPCKSQVHVKHFNVTRLDAIKLSMVCLKSIYLVTYSQFLFAWQTFVNKLAQSALSLCLYEFINWGTDWVQFMF